jgi:hypothetical protein
MRELLEQMAGSGKSITWSVSFQTAIQDGSTRFKAKIALLGSRNMNKNLIGGSHGRA